ncbi:hypothetical protein Vretimale_6018 [Volvox reticuliferus]|uniref:CBM20 domain-containing protein n=1 Tax=Volvox reticuliferus TaxID=1737510 RepID=A0A8J4LL85_9CHLO|nr:hypothetical protein Vretifemale_6168 [Volvox reticuliferus]GIM01186.1 hypothetical protein Vretimale_6018 [Volvox reticuliferus]
MQTSRARGPQCPMSGRRCQAQRHLASRMKPSLCRALSAVVVAFGNEVPVTISMKCKVEYGESLRIVGNQPFLGSWDPSKAPEMSWNDGNVWKADTLVPVGVEVDFKVVRAKRDGGAVVWEEGDNRSFKALGPEYGLQVTCHWGRPHDMKIDTYRVQEQQGVAPMEVPTASSNGTENGNGVVAPSRLEGGSRASRSDSPVGSISMDSNDSSSSNNGTGRSSPSATMAVSRSSFEEESVARGAWVGAEPEFVRSRRKDEQGREGVWRTDGLSGVALELVRGDQEASSWLKKLGLQKRLLVDEATACRPSLEALSYLYVYATWINTGALPCAESGSHFRPNHHANLALAMFRSLEWVIGDATRGGGSRNLAAECLILAARRMHARLPSFSGQFRASTPLTRIRDIAHRNDIPKDLKDEIKHTLQNKLHRCAGPEDLVATEAMLQRVTAVPGQYSEAFVAEFRIFTEELREFFNATGLVELLTGGGALDALEDAHASAVRQLINTKQRVEELGSAARLDDLMALLTSATQARSFYAAGLVAGLRNDVTDEILSMRQRWRLADIRLEEYSFVVLSRITGLLEEQGAATKLPRASNLQWALPLAALTSGLRHMGLSLFNTRELMVLENELQKWHSTCPLVETRDAALRAKASLERALRVATGYSDLVSEVYGNPAATLGRALGLPEHMGAVFAEAEVRASVAFQVSKLAAMLARALRTAAGQEPWDVLVPGEVSGMLREVAQLGGTALEGPSASAGDEGVVLVVRRASGDEELGPLGPQLRGVVLLQELPHLSHLGVRARQDGVTFVTCDDDDTVSRVLRPLIGRRVTVNAREDCTVTVKETTIATAVTSSSKTAASAAVSAATPAPKTAADAALDAASARAVAAAAKAGRWADVVVPLERAVTATCGSKSAKCAALEKLAAGSGGMFSAPRGAVVPFGALGAAVATAGRAAEFEALLARLDDPRSDGAELETACGEMRTLVSGLEVPMGLVQQVMETIRAVSSDTVASPSTGPQSLLLAVRSSANVEDLAGMSAAGLYDSVVGVPADNPVAVGTAVSDVWASLYTRRAVLSRRAAGVSQSSAHMAVLIMEMVAPDLSFVLHTARPRDGNREVLLAEVAPGQGETLASGTRGTPWRFEVTKSDGAVTTMAFANFSTALVLPSKGKSVAAFASYGSGAATAATATSGASPGRSSGALVEREVDYGAQRMSVDGDWRKATVRQMAAIGSYIEKAMDGVPQDIEGGVVVLPDGRASLHIFQTRPQ